ncbi:hypothetical protein ACLOJK_006122 [Asimina triloba]
MNKISSPDAAANTAAASPSAPAPIRSTVLRRIRVQKPARTPVAAPSLPLEADLGRSVIGECTRTKAIENPFAPIPLRRVHIHAGFENSTCVADRAVETLVSKKTKTVNRSGLGDRERERGASEGEEDEQKQQRIQQPTLNHRPGFHLPNDGRRRSDEDDVRERMAEGFKNPNQRTPRGAAKPTSLRLQRVSNSRARIVLDFHARPGPARSYCGTHLYVSMEENYYH